MAGQPAPGSNAVLTFDVTGVEILENPAGGVLGAPTTIIPVGSDLVARVSFALAGLVAPFVASTLQGYRVIVRAESLGSGFEDDIGTFAGNLAAGQLNYGPAQPAPIPQVSITAGGGAGQLPIGVYKLVAVVTFDNPALPLVGYSEGPIVQIVA